MCEGTDGVDVQLCDVFDRNLQYPRYHCIIPMFLLVDNSDSPSIGKQSQQGHDSSCNSLLTVVPGSVMYPIPYACQLAFYNVSMFCSIPNECSLLHLVICVDPCVKVLTLSTGFCSPFYLGCSLFAP